MTRATRPGMYSCQESKSEATDRINAEALAALGLFSIRVWIERHGAAVRTISMRMSLPKQSMFQAFESLYVGGQPAEQVLADHSTLAASPLTALAIGVAARVRKAAMEVAKVHSMDVADFWAMSCIVAGHVLAVRSPCSAVERLLLGVLAPHL